MVAIARDPVAEPPSESAWAIPEAVVQKQILLNRLLAGQHHAASSGGGRASASDDTKDDQMQLQRHIGHLLDRLAAEHAVDDDSRHLYEDGERAYDAGMEGAAEADPAVYLDDSVPAERGEASIDLLRSLAAALESPSPTARESSHSRDAVPGRRASLFPSPGTRVDQPDGAAQALAVPQSATQTPASTGTTRPVTAAFEDRFPALCGGLVNRLAAMEDQGIQWHKGSNVGGLTMDMAELSGSIASAMGHARGMASPLSEAGGANAVELSPEQERAAAISQLRHDVFGLDAAGGSGSPSGPSNPDDNVGKPSSRHVDLEQMLELAKKEQLLTSSSRRWPRIYRPPRVRGGHVILDLCVPDIHEAEPSMQGATELEGARLERHVSKVGDLKVLPYAAYITLVAHTGLASSLRSCPMMICDVLQTVTRSDVKGSMGRSIWQLARDVEWGDLWPSWYSSSTRRKAEVQDPDSKQVQLRRRANESLKEEQEQEALVAALKEYGFDTPEKKP